MAGISNDETQERSFDTTLMARLLKFARPYWWMLLISLVLICILTAKTIACPLIVRQAIDNYIDPTTARFVRVDALEDVQTANGVVGGVDRFVLGGHSYYDSTELTKGLRLSGKSVQTTDVSLYVVAPDKARQLGIDRL
ncbi:hypothetical protein SMC3_09090, partial [Candidatus Cryosericum hinesii]